MGADLLESYVGSISQELHQHVSHRIQPFLLALILDLPFTSGAGEARKDCLSPLLVVVGTSGVDERCFEQVWNPEHSHDVSQRLQRGLSSSCPEQMLIPHL